MRITNRNQVGAVSIFLCVLLSGCSSGPQKSELESNKITRGETLYIRYCADCHGWDANGEGSACLIFQEYLTRIRSVRLSRICNIWARSPGRLLNKKSCIDGMPEKDVEKVEFENSFPIETPGIEFYSQKKETV